LKKRIGDAILLNCIITVSDLLSYDEKRGEKAFGPYVKFDKDG